MASPNVLFRNQVCSPTRKSFKRRSPRSILKRPSPLKLASNPSPFASSITIVVSPAISSPHVHFPASPVLIAVFSTHSPDSYDRSATKVTPNPLDLPAWGQRVYSPGEGAFSSVKSPPVTVPIVFVGAPLSEEDTDVNPLTPKGVRFRARGSRPRDLGKSLILYPRSPYPSAPPSPASRDKENSEINLARARSLDSPKTKRHLNRPASLKVPAVRPSTPRLSSPLATRFLSPVVESPGTAIVTSATPTVVSSLRQEFWQSVSLESAVEHHELSVMELHEEGSTPISAIPTFVFGTKNGMLWSPGLPRKVRPSIGDIRSPTDSTSFEFEKIDGEMITSPGDQKLTYPSISSVLAMDVEKIAYPPPVINSGSPM